MLRQAAKRDAAALDLAVGVAQDAFPDSAPAIDAVAQTLRQERATQEKTVKQEAARSVLAGWSGEAEAGAALATGNSDDKAVTLRLDLSKETVKWRHELEATADLQRADGETSTERYTAAYEADYFLGKYVYAAGAFSWERDIIAGYRHRLTETAGIGFVLLDDQDSRLSVEFSPGARHIFEVLEPGVDATKHEFVFRSAADFTQQLGNGVKFAQTAKALIGTSNQTLESTSSLTARINSLLSARFSVTLRHETEPPDDRKATDTLSKATLVYSF